MEEKKNSLYLRELRILIFMLLWIRKVNTILNILIPIVLIWLYKSGISSQKLVTSGHKYCNFYELPNSPILRKRGIFHYLPVCQSVCLSIYLSIVIASLSFSVRSLRERRWLINQKSGGWDGGCDKLGSWQALLGCSKLAEGLLSEGRIAMVGLAGSTMLWSVLFNLSFSLPSCVILRDYFYFYFIDEKSKALRHQLTWPNLHS